MESTVSKNNQKEFEIIHLSFRKVKSEGRGINYYIGNIVFRMLYGEGKQMLERDMEEYESVRVATDLDLLKRYDNSLEFKFGEIDEKTGTGKLDIVSTEGIKREDVYIKAYHSNTRPLNKFLQYNEKFDCYQMREYFQDNPVVRGIIQYLQDMKDGKPNPTNTMYYHQLICTLENLCWWWD